MDIKLRYMCIYMHIYVDVSTCSCTHILRWFLCSFYLEKSEYWTNSVTLTSQLHITQLLLPSCYKRQGQVQLCAI